MGPMDSGAPQTFLESVFCIGNVANIHELYALRYEQFFLFLYIAKYKKACIFSFPIQLFSPHFFH